VVKSGTSCWSFSWFNAVLHSHSTDSVCMMQEKDTGAVYLAMDCITVFLIMCKKAHFMSKIHQVYSAVFLFCLTTPLSQIKPISVFGQAHL
jgi:hypothetical protein